MFGHLACLTMEVYHVNLSLKSYISCFLTVKGVKCMEGACIISFLVLKGVESKKANM